MKNLKPKLADYTEQQFIALIRELDGADTERERDILLDHFNIIVPHPAGSDLLFFPEPGADYSDEGVVRTIREWCAANDHPGFKSPY